MEVLDLLAGQLQDRETRRATMERHQHPTRIA